MPKGDFGIIGLGRMGSQMVERMLSRGYKVVGYDVDQEKVRPFAERPNFHSARGFDEMNKVESGLVMLSVPAGAVDDAIEKVYRYIWEDGTVADLGNSKWEDSIRRYDRFRAGGKNYLDVGITGGLEIECEGAGVMVGGDRGVFERYEPLFRDIAAPDGLVYAGSRGMGHFVKAVHNAVEYVILQAIAEGVEALDDMRDHQAGFAKVSDILRVWDKGVNPRLIRYAAEVMKDAESGKINMGERDDYMRMAGGDVTGKVGGGETGRWVLEYLENVDVRMPGLKTAMSMRESSEENDFQGMIINLLRNRFGGHPCGKGK